MHDLTVDVCILIRGFHSDSANYCEHSRCVLDNLLSRESHSLALDSKKRIRYEYEHHLQRNTLAISWLTLMASRGKIMVYSTKMPRTLRVKLDEAHFHVPDRKYVETALASKTKKIVTGDGDYSKKVKKILKRNASISVLRAEDACSLA